MTTTDRPHVVLGAAGGTGAAVVDELLRRDLPVRAITRGAATPPDGAEHVRADLADADAAREAIAGAGVVYHAVNPPYHRWVEEFPELNRSIAAATASAGARLVFADNLYMDGPGAGVMTEQTPVRATDKKGRLRASLAANLLALHEAGTLEVTIGRSPDYFGPGGVNSALGATLFGPAIGGTSARWLGSLDAPHSVVYLPDLARGLVTLGLGEAATGRVWHLPTNGTPTGREFIAALATAADRPVKGSATPRWLLRLIGLARPDVREIADITYQWQAPFESSAAAFEETFGPQTMTPLPEAIAQTLAWFETRAAEGTPDPDA